MSPLSANSIPREPLRKDPPFWILGAILVIQYVRPQDVIPGLGALHIPMFVSIFAAGIWLFFRDYSALRDPQTKLFGAMLVLVALGVSWAVNYFWLYTSFELLLIYFLGVFLPIVTFCNSTERLQRLNRTWICVHLFVALWGIAHSGKGQGSFLKDENDLAMALGIALPFAYFNFVNKSETRMWRAISAISFMVFIAAIIETNSRGGFIGLLAAVGGIIWLSKSRLRIIIALFAVGIVAFPFIPAEYRDQVTSISDTDDPTRLSRYYTWSRGWEMFLDNPVVGVGAGNYPWRVEEYELASTGDDFGKQKLHGGRAAHSLYFTLLPELGTLGVMVFASMAIISLRRFRRGMRFDASSKDESLVAFSKAGLCGLLSFLLSAVFLSALYYPHFWVLAGYSAVVARVSCGVLKSSREPARFPSLVS